MTAGYLERRGYEVLEANWRCPGLGEIDLVARKAGCLVFVEVRVRSGQAYGTPEESVTPEKRARLIALAEAYVQQAGWAGDWRIDMMALEVSRSGRLVRRHYIENAVTGWEH